MGLNFRRFQIGFDVAILIVFGIIQEKVDPFLDELGLSKKRGLFSRLFIATDPGFL